ncbi:uncharacterized protein MRET_1772 [Malassezia restricta]|uniref:Uncharacterized protein n=2 Tax=Malassezia TaxID=55193 RepID=A0A3G2S4I6_MALR7|nr:uncharacterized protein MRET_1772 [Malassezia restricta]AXA50042.1 uncharacterized protein MRET_1772 [Malassezia restricta]AYO43001.1 hypothetical protein DNF11_2051 [Malassezia restricta CBS 7877]WFD15901.1 hypothetical protein MARU1_001927 [Malassezia arunalokei]
MTQGFKPLKRPTPAKGKSSTQAKPKVGKRIAPKKQSALSEAIQKRKNTASSTSRIEKEMAGRAQKGPLTIMRSLAKEANEEQKKK